MSTALRRWRLEPLALVGVLAAIWLIAAPRTADLAAQVYRSELFAREGFAIWDNAWFGGHHLPGYSLVFPSISGLIGPRTVGVLAVAASALLFAEIMRRHAAPRGHLAALWFAMIVAGDLYIGRLTFALGIAIALGAVLALMRGRYAWGAALAAAAAAASPVAGLFLGLGVLAALSRLPPRWRGVVFAAPLVVVLALALVFPEGGRQPYDLAAALLGLTVTVTVFFLLDPARRTLRRGVALYAIAVAAAYLIPSPMGSNAARLGVLFAGPLLLIGLRSDVNRRLVAGVCAVLVAWQLAAPVSEVFKARAGVAATKADYFAPLLDFLAANGAHAGRVEVVPTATRWESVYVARRFALARGWETQLDRGYNALFYKRRLSAGRYERWLRDSGVRFVALADTPKERWGRQEERLLRRSVSFLTPAWRNRHWRVFAVRDPRPMVTGGTLARLSSTGFRVRLSPAGVARVRVRYTPFWSVAWPACARPTADGFTVIASRGGAVVDVRARWSLRAPPLRAGSCGRLADAPQRRATR